MNRRNALGLAALVMAASAALLLRRLAHRSGATQAEVDGSLPGDHLVPHPMLETTRAITIRAPAVAVWPWLAQMGYHRGGWYTNAWLDKLIWRIDNPSADLLLAEYQHPQVGDTVPDGPEGTARFTIAAIEPGYALALHDHDGTHIPRVDFSWTFVVREIDATTARLLVRTRATYPPGMWMRPMAYLLAGPADFLMAHVMLMRGVKRRAERLRDEAMPGAYAPLRTGATVGITGQAV